MRGWGGGVCQYEFFSFQCPAISPTPREQTGGQNLTLCRSKLTLGKDPNVKTLSFPLHCWDNQNIIAPHFSPVIPHPSP